MRPTEILASEHRIIEQVLSCLERITERAATGSMSWTDARQVVDFLRTFADECHHQKEERHLFPKMEARGFPRVCGPTGVMLAEHEQGRHAIQGMAQAVALADFNPHQARADFVRHARAYLPLLRQHILKEENRLFPMANQVFSESDQDELANAFEEVENAEEHAGIHAKYLQLADELAERYGVPHGQATGLSAACSCGHAMKG